MDSRTRIAIIKAVHLSQFNSVTQAFDLDAISFRNEQQVFYANPHFHNNASTLVYRLLGYHDVPPITRTWKLRVLG